MHFIFSLESKIKLKSNAASFNRNGFIWVLYLALKKINKKHQQKKNYVEKCKEMN